MKKIYWFIQRVKHMGGAERVTVDIVNKLSTFRDICLIVVGEEHKDYPLDVSPNVEVKYLNIPYQYTNLDEHVGFLKKQHKHIKASLDFLKGVTYWFFRKGKFKKLISSMTTKDDILIFSSYDNYLMAPKDRRCLFHFHFNASFFFSIMATTGRWWHRRPDKYIFLTETTKDVVEKKRKAYKDSYMVYNPIRFPRKENNEYYNNELLFLARYAKQKNPMLAVKVMKELKDMNCKCHLSMYGNGFLLKDITKYVDDNNLSDYVTINPETKDALSKIRESDMLLLTSVFEGLPLVIIEANSQSVPVISSNWGDAAKEVVIDGENGYMIDSVDPKAYALKIKEVFDDKEKLMALKKKSFESSARFSDEAIVAKWKEILEKEDNINM